MRDGFGTNRIVELDIVRSAGVDREREQRSGNWIEGAGDYNAGLFLVSIQIFSE